ncbi:phage tail assembly chaperone [Telmatospirillum sp. J64-1]|uniref:phage tail assembly chaperone n=1 Tax=Telmatospirillum sp. J64-1 TaxID=2502183 RepID=UPI00115E944F|nr:hypothetical protein [Telmatospirillum sp. J64-1]
MSQFEEFTAGSLTLRAKRIDARKQFHVARRLASLLGRVGEIDAVASEPLKAAALLGEALAGLPDEQVDYILDVALDAAEVKQDGGTGWAPLRARGVLMYELDMPALLTVAGRVLWANMQGFMSALPGLGNQVQGLMASRG